MLSSDTPQKDTPLTNTCRTSPFQTFSLLPSPSFFSMAHFLPSWESGNEDFCTRFPPSFLGALLHWAVQGRTR